MPRTRHSKKQEVLDAAEVIREKIMKTIQFPLVHDYKHPTKYNPEKMIPIMMDLVRDGKSLIYVAATFGVSKETMASWGREYPEWGKAMMNAMTILEGVWEQIGIKGMNTTFFNNKMYEILVRHHFKWNTSDKGKATTNIAIDNSKTETKNIETSVKVDIGSLDVKDLKNLKSIVARAGIKYIPEEINNHE